MTNIYTKYLINKKLKNIKQKLKAKTKPKPFKAQVRSCHDQNIGKPNRLEVYVNR
jgi:hypothetical protein